MNNTPTTGRLFDVVITRDVTESAVVRVVADCPAEAVDVALTAERQIEMSQAMQWDRDDVTPEVASICDNEPEDVAQLAHDPDVDEGAGPSDQPIYMLRDGEPIMAHKPERDQRQPTDADRIAAVEACIAQLKIDLQPPSGTGPWCVLSLVEFALQSPFAKPSALSPIAPAGMLPAIAVSALEASQTALALLAAEVEQLVQFTRPTFNDDAAIERATDAGEDAALLIASALTLPPAPVAVLSEDVGAVLEYATSFVDDWQNDEGLGEDRAPADDARATLERVAPLIEAACTHRLPRVAVVMDGGCVQAVIGDATVDVMVVDYDVETSADDYPQLSQGEGQGTKPASVYVSTAEVHPEWLDMVEEAERLNSAAIDPR